jgi:hypothetical protein
MSTNAPLSRKAATVSEIQPKWRSDAGLDPHRADIASLQLYAGGPTALCFVAKRCGECWGYAGCAGSYAQAFLGLEVPKDLQVSDWGAEELSPGQIAYAASDAILAWRLWPRMAAELTDKQRWNAYELQRRAIPAVGREGSRQAVRTCSSCRPSARRNLKRALSLLPGIYWSVATGLRLRCGRPPGCTASRC